MWKLENLCWGLSVFVTTGAAAFVLAGVGLGTLRPWPAMPERADRSAEWRERQRADELLRALEREQERHLATLVLLDQLRRGAILFPSRPSELPDGDRIPVQNLPTGAAVVPAIPAAK